MCAAAFSPSVLGAKELPNIIYIVTDQQTASAMSCMGNTDVQTPNMDRLAASGVLFQNAYCNIPVSGASRASLLTGVYPHYPDRFISFSAYASKDCPEAIPISGWFTRNGYHTISDGKVFHHISDHADSWSEPPYRNHPNGYDVYWAEYNKWELWMNSESGKTINPKTMRGPFCESADVPDTAYDDGKLANRAIRDLKRMKEAGKPFFLACGFWKPHLPFNAPKKYWDLYKREEIPLATNRFRPEGLPEQVRNSSEIYAYARVADTSDIDFQREVKHGYYACMSYVDAQIGKVLDALDELGLSDNTIVVLLGDHGWNLGEHDFIGKHNLMNTSTHVPLIVRVPGMKKGKTKSMVEFVDLYPTLCELCKLPVPAEQLSGQSFAGVFKNLKAKTKGEVYIQWEGGDNAVDRRYSYAEWMKGDVKKASMLFDHRIDGKENKNRVDEKKYKNKVESLSSFIRIKKSSLKKLSNKFSLKIAGNISHFSFRISDGRFIIRPCNCYVCACCRLFDSDNIIRFDLRCGFRNRYLQDTVLKLSVYVLSLYALAYIEASAALTLVTLTSDVTSGIFLLFILIQPLNCADR